MRVNISDKVYIPNQTKPFRVRARDNRYIICTKWCNLHGGAPIYFIVDLKAKRRAPDNRVFCEGYVTDEQCQKRLKELQSGELELSWRRGVDLDIDIE